MRNVQYSHTEHLRARCVIVNWTAPQAAHCKPGLHNEISHVVSYVVSHMVPCVLPCMVTCKVPYMVPDNTKHMVHYRIYFDRFAVGPFR
jgi:hypothetical protein